MEGETRGCGTSMANNPPGRTMTESPRTRVTNPLPKLQARWRGVSCSLIPGRGLWPRQRACSLSRGPRLSPRGAEGCLLRTRGPWTPAWPRRGQPHPEVSGTCPLPVTSAVWVRLLPPPALTPQRRLVNVSGSSSPTASENPARPCSAPTPSPALHLPPGLPPSTSCRTRRGLRRLLDRAPSGVPAARPPDPCRANVLGPGLPPCG